MKLIYGHAKIQPNNKGRIYQLLIVIIALLILNLNVSHAQSIKEKKVGVEGVGLEFIGSVAGIFAIGIPAGYIISSATPPVSDGFGKVVLVVSGACLAGEIVGAPTGTILIGKAIRHKGSILGAYGGSLFGVALGIASIYVGDKIGLTLNGLTIPTLMSLPPLCSVLGYNLCGSKNSSSSMFLNYAPQCAITLRPLENNKRIIPEIGMKLTVKF